MVERVTCEFCDEAICEFFADVDASRLIRSTIVEHLAWCSRRPGGFAGMPLRTYAGVVVELHRRKREYRDVRRRFVAQSSATE